MTTKENKVRFGFFGTSHIAVFVLDALEHAGLLPAFIVAPPDRPQGRGLALAACPVKEWALAHAIPLLQPEKLDDAFVNTMQAQGMLDACVVCDYGKILPQAVLAIPQHGFLNVHPSLLPHLRGASPVRSAILQDERETGVTVMLIDEKMDHGPVIAQKRIVLPAWPPKNAELERLLMEEGGKLLAHMLPLWVRGEVEAREQNHDLATFSAKFTKEDGLLNLADEPYRNLLKIRALEGWPGTYAFFERNGVKMRVQILDAHIAEGALVLDRVKPEGKKEMPYEDFARSGARPL